MPPRPVTATKGGRKTDGKASPKKGKKGKKKAAKEEVQFEDLSASTKKPIPLGVCPVGLSHLTQERFGCKEGVDLTPEKPWKILSKQAILDDIEHPVPERRTWEAAPKAPLESDFVSYKAELESYVEDQVLLVWDEEVNYGQRFYLVLTLKQRVIENETLLATAPVLAAALPSASLDVYLAHAWGRLETDKRCVALSQALEKREWKCWYDPHGHIRDDVDLPLATGIANTKVVILCLSAHAVETIRKGRLRDKAVKEYMQIVNTKGLQRIIPVALEDFEWPAAISHGPVGTLKSHPNAVSVACSGAKLDEAIKRLDETLRGLCAEGPVRLAPSREELLKRASSNSVVTLGFGAEGLGIDLNAGDDIACSPLLEAFKARLAARLEMEARSPPRLCQVRGGYELRTVRANCVIRIEVDSSLMLLYRSPSPNSEVVGVPVLQRDEVVMMIKSTWPTRVRADDIAIHMLEDGGATMHAGIDPRLGLILIQLNRKRDPELVALGISSVAPHTHSNAMLEAARGNQLSAKDEAVERISKLMFKFDMAPRFIGKS